MDIKIWTPELSGQPLRGIYTGMPAEEYFAVEAASNSFLKDVRRSPAHAKHKEPEDYDTRNKEIGSAIHCALLEPDEFKTRYFLCEADKRTDAFYRGMAADHGGAFVLTRPEYKRITGMMLSAYRNKRFAKYMNEPGYNEISFFSVDPETGVPVKCRFDRLVTAGYALDLKKCQDARGVDFTKAITNYGYYQQVAFYMAVHEWETGERLKKFPLAAVEEKAPHGFVMHDLDEVALILGRKHFREALNKYAECVESGVWPSYDSDSEVTSVTSWAAGELDEEGIL